MIHSDEKWEQGVRNDLVERQKRRVEECRMKLRSTERGWVKECRMN